MIIDHRTDVDQSRQERHEARLAADTPTTPARPTAESGELPADDREALMAAAGALAVASGENVAAEFIRRFVLRPPADAAGLRIERVVRRALTSLAGTDALDPRVSKIIDEETAQAVAAFAAHPSPPDREEPAQEAGGCVHRWKYDRPRDRLVVTETGRDEMGLPEAKRGYTVWEQRAVCEWCGKVEVVPVQTRPTPGAAA